MLIALLVVAEFNLTILQEGLSSRPPTAVPGDGMGLDPSCPEWVCSHRSFDSI